MKRLIELAAVIGIAGLAWYLWKTYGTHATDAGASATRQGALQDQQTHWRLPWQDKPDTFSNLANSIGVALGYYDAEHADPGHDTFSQPKGVPTTKNGP
jgi:hypothetical protein